jgi:hypothetical protein
VTDPFRAAAPATSGDTLVPLAGLLLASLEGRLTPRRWRAPGFGRRVDDVRAHLAPIVASELLEESFAREAFRSEPVRLAYAIRWLELAECRPMPGWLDLAGRPPDRTRQARVSRLDRPSRTRSSPISNSAP